jgi:uncharacterized protein (TIGR02996 family)
MSKDTAFLQAMLASPEDASTRLVYADWLEQRGDGRGEFLRLDLQVERYNREDGSESNLERRHRELAATIDPGWLTLVTTLGRPFQQGPRSRDFFDCEASERPFTEPLGTRGRIVTFECQFRGEQIWQAGLAEDLQLLSGLELDECAYGAASIAMHPFICELATDRYPLTGADVLSALKARAFRSEHLAGLEATRIAYPGYHPGTDNDEIHNDFMEQYLFVKRPEDSGGPINQNEPVDEFSGTHGVLKRYVRDGDLWYVLLHIAPFHVPGDGRRGMSRYVILLAVGRSPHGKRLVGVITHQVCHNLCD